MFIELRMQLKFRLFISQRGCKFIYVNCNTLALSAAQSSSQVKWNITNCSTCVVWDFEFSETIVDCNYSNISTFVFVVCVCIYVFVCLPSLRRNKRAPRQSNQASAILTSWGFAAHNIRPARCEGFVRFCTIWMHLWQCTMPKTRFLTKFIAVSNIECCSCVSFYLLSCWIHLNFRLFITMTLKFYLDYI